MIGTLSAMTDRRSILVTGAASGIGAAICRMMAGPDTAILVHTRRNRDGAEAVAREVQEAGGMASVALGDLAEPEVAAALVATAVRCFGRLDVLVSNAGFADRTALADLSNQALVASTEAIQGAFFRLAQVALPHLRTAPQGRVVAVSSFVAHAFRPGLPTFTASAAAKAGLEALVRALAIRTGFGWGDGERGGAGLHPQGSRGAPADWLGGAGGSDRSHSVAADRFAGGGRGGGDVPGVTGGGLCHRTGDPCGWRTGDVMGGAVSVVVRDKLRR
jgi:NADP-dependent 3-hydroxy acid dehydrogenase YdfG